MNQSLILLLGIALVFMWLCRKEYDQESFVNPLPYRSFYEPLGDENNGKFLWPQPYSNLENTHYHQMWNSKSKPKFPQPGSPHGYFHQNVDEFERPDMLKSEYLGYSISGQPYNSMNVSSKPKNGIDIHNLPEKQFYEKEGWIKYQPTPKEAHYYGKPFYFHGKQHR